MPQIDQIDHEFTDAPDVPLIAEGKTTFNSKASGWLTYWKTIILPEITAFISKLRDVITGINAASADIDTKHAEVVSSTAIVQALANGTYMPNYVGSGTVAANTTVSYNDAIWYTPNGTEDVPNISSVDWIMVSPVMREARFYSESYLIEYGNSDILDISAPSGTEKYLHKVDLRLIRQGTFCQITGSFSVTYSQNLVAGTVYYANLDILKIAHDLGVFGHIKYTEKSVGTVGPATSMSAPFSSVDTAKLINQFIFVDSAKVYTFFKPVVATNLIDVDFNITVEVGDEYMPYEAYFPVTDIQIPAGTQSVDVSLALGHAPSLGESYIIFDGGDGYVTIGVGDTTTSTTIDTSALSSGESTTLTITMAIANYSQPHPGIGSDRQCTITAV